MAKSAIPVFSASFFKGSISLQVEMLQDKHGNILTNFSIPKAKWLP
jgi:hypothetical protein